MMLLRTAREEDLPAIVRIYNQAIDEQFCTGDTRPVSVDGRRDWFKQHAADAYPIFVLEEQGEILGWCSLSPYRPGRDALRQTAEISYYVDRSSRGRGIGSRLMQHALAEAPGRGLTHLLAILMDRNSASIQLLKKHQFQQWGHLPQIARFSSGVCGQFIYGRKI